MKKHDLYEQMIDGKSVSCIVSFLNRRAISITLNEPFQCSFGRSIPKEKMEEKSLAVKENDEYVTTEAGDQLVRKLHKILYREACYLVDNKENMKAMIDAALSRRESNIYRLQGEFFPNIHHIEMDMEFLNMFSKQFLGGDCDQIYIDRHVKDISKGKFTVFLTEPIYLECEIEPLPYYEGQNVSVASRHTGRLVLNANGYYHARRALEALKRKAAFFVAHEDEFEGFLAVYHQEYDKISTAVQKARMLTQKARDVADWQTQPGLLRKQMVWEYKLQNLYRDMYLARFGEKAVYLSEDSIQELKSK